MKKAIRYYISFKIFLLKTVLIAFFLMGCLVVVSQEKNPIFIGIQPSVTKEKFYEQNEFDVNILPFVLEYPIAKRINLRFTSILNYHFGDNSQVSGIGLQIVVPIFFKKRESKAKPSYGFYVGPVLGLGQNLVNDHFTTTLALEPGYQFKTNKRFTVSLGIQYGGSNFNYKKLESEWVEHFGMKVNLGFWL